MWITVWWGQDVLQAPAFQNHLTSIRCSAPFSMVASSPSGSQGRWKPIPGVKKIDRAHTQLTHSLTLRSNLSSWACLWTCWGGWRTPAEEARECAYLTRKPQKLQPGFPRIPDFIFLLEIESFLSQVNRTLTTQKSVVCNRDWYWSMVERTLRIRHARTMRNLQEGKQSKC